MKLPFKHYKLLNFLDSKQWQFQLSVLLFLLVLATTYPKYIELLNDPSPVTTYQYLFEKIECPLTPLLNGDIESHGSKIAFRLTPVLLAKLLGTYDLHNGQGIIQLYLLQSLLLLPFLYMLTKVVYELTDKYTTVWTVVAFSAVYTSTAFFWDYDFWFDGYAYFFLMAAMYFRNRIGIFLMLQLASWTDERAIAASIGVFLFYTLMENNFQLIRMSQIIPSSIKKRAAIVIISLLTYLFLRLYLTLFFNLHTPIGNNAGVGLELIEYQINHRLIGLFLSFEGLWLIFVVTIIVSLRKGNFILATLLICGILIHIIVAFSVFDISRSLAYAFPYFIVCTVILFKNHRLALNNSLSVSTLLCILVPTQFLIYFVRPIPWTIFSYSEIIVVGKNVFYALK